MTAELKRDGEAGRFLPVPAQWIGPYRLIEQLGEGGMGVVHLALDQSGRAVAIKVLREHIAHDSEARSRLTREVQTLARVQDARVAAVLDADTEGLRPYIVTRYVPGPSLDRVVSDSGALKGESLLRLGRGLSQALQAIHGAGVIHRDLKPANVLLLDGDPVVIDFGIAHFADDIRLTVTGLVMGTPGYLSPEVVEGGPVTEATDWWGWAATLAFAASGAPPFGRGPMDVVLDRVRRGQADLSGVDPLLAPLLQAALSPIAGVRPHADEIVDALDRYAVGAPATLSFPVSFPVLGAEPSPPLEDELWDREPEQDWQEPEWREDLEGGPGQPDPRIGRPSRVGTLLALMVGVLGVAAVWPVVAVGLIILWSWCARFADRSVTSLVLRRHERGRRRRDIPVAVIVSPWHVVIAAAATVIALLLPATIAIASTFSTALAVMPWSGGDPQPGRSLPIVVGGFVGLLMAWWGPGGASLRRGSRTLIRGVAPGRTTTELVVAVFFLLGAGLGVWSWLRHGQPDLWPWPRHGQPSMWPWTRLSPPNVWPWGR
ncbi:MAG: protein kinase domain-containing protein [Dermatophilaceae bacterium]